MYMHSIINMCINVTIDNTIQYSWWLGPAYVFNLLFVNRVAVDYPVYEKHMKDRRPRTNQYTTTNYNIS